ncbi:hypothetical protein THRCLA_20479 [Thraustotheca clavata]|uniref:Uncharacterized protein n=1 Tax=Thraustotheca clavata TaxID=74557 RepID=A0A1W0A6X6_9STRA|nr:hypothetical protein THRCLA_20479 [Thraustotheca clavata]
MISLAHLKASQDAATNDVSVRRIAWPGGKLVSNKEEALRKFMERKQALAEAKSSAVGSPAKSCEQGRSKHSVGHKVQPNGPSKPLHTKKRDYKHTKKNNVIFKTRHHQAKEDLPTASKLSMSLDDIVKNAK